MKAVGWIKERSDGSTSRAAVEPLRLFHPTGSVFRCAEAGRWIVSLDDLDERDLAQRDPVLFLQRHPPPLIIDEVQSAPELFSAIKMAVDQTKQFGQSWLTGSQKFHLMRGITESRAGRVAILDLLGLAQQPDQSFGQDSQAVFSRNRTLCVPHALDVTRVTRGGSNVRCHSRDLRDRRATEELLAQWPGS
jgi:hypothetical protein